MKSCSYEGTTEETSMTQSQGQGKLSRRTLFTGVGAVGAVAAATSVLPVAPAAPAPVVALKPAPERGGGYQLTEHVKQYYKTTRL
jgi:secreted PhoX family phosphatase